MDNEARAPARPGVLLFHQGPTLSLLVLAWFLLMAVVLSKVKLPK